MPAEGGARIVQGADEERGYMEGDADKASMRPRLLPVPLYLTL